MNKRIQMMDLMLRAAICDETAKRESNPEDVSAIVTDTLPEAFEKLIILHVRLWNLEDRSRDTDDDVERGIIKAKIDYCNGVTRPRLLQAISSGLPVEFMDVKHYGKDHPA